MTEPHRNEQLDARGSTPRRAPIFPLRLPASLRAAVDRLARAKGTSANQFIVMAVAEKVSALAATETFERRAAQADDAGFDRIMSRRTNAPEDDADRME